MTASMKLSFLLTANGRFGLAEVLNRDRKLEKAYLVKTYFGIDHISPTYFWFEICFNRVDPVSSPMIDLRSCLLKIWVGCRGGEGWARVFCKDIKRVVLGWSWSRVLCDDIRRDVWKGRVCCLKGFSSRGCCCIGWRLWRGCDGCQHQREAAWEFRLDPLNLT